MNEDTETRSQKNMVKIDMSILPNPVTYSLLIKNKNEKNHTEKFNVKVYNQIGQQVAVFNFFHQHYLNVESWLPGIYYFEFNLDGITQSYQIIKI